MMKKNTPKKLSAFILPSSWMFSVILFLLFLLPACQKENLSTTRPETEIPVAKPGTSEGYSLKQFNLFKKKIKAPIWERSSMRRGVIPAVELNWQATGEATYLENYQVQFSYNNEDFITLAVVQPSLSDSPSKHTLTSSFFITGYFRLKINLKDGTVQYSKTLEATP